MSIVGQWTRDADRGWIKYVVKVQSKLCMILWHKIAKTLKALTEVSSLAKVMLESTEKAVNQCALSF